MPQQADNQSTSRITQPPADSDISSAQGPTVPTNGPPKWKRFLSVVLKVIALPVNRVLKPVWEMLKREANALEALSALLAMGAIVYGVISYVGEEPQRQQASHNTAWQVINSATGQVISGGRIEALQELNRDNIPLEGLVAHSANLQKIELPNANLSHANLQGANLQGANLQGANLEGADLSYAILLSATLRGADLQSATLLSATLKGANLEGAVLPSGNLQYANLIRANLKGADLSHAYLQYARLQYAILEDAILEDANLQGANLFNAQLQGVSLQRANLPNVVLQEANLQEADLLATYLLGADFTDADLSNADFRYSKKLLASQIRHAKDWDRALFDTNLREELGPSP